MSVAIEEHVQYDVRVEQNDQPFPGPRFAEDEAVSMGKRLIVDGPVGPQRASNEGNPHP